MSMESPSCMVACMTAPSGRFCWKINSPSNAAVMNSINRDAPWANRYGVMAWNPSGIGFVGIWLCWVDPQAALHEPNAKEMLAPSCFAQVAVVNRSRVSWLGILQELALKAFGCVGLI